MNDTKAILVPDKLHAALKVRAAQLGIKLGDMCAQKLAELVADQSDPAQPMLDLSAPKSAAA